MTTLRRIFLATSLAVLGTAIASADPIFTQTNSATFGPATTDFTWSVSVGGFTVPTGYHLTGITLEVSGAVSAPTFSLQNNGGTSQKFGLFFGSVLNINSNSASGDAVGDVIVVPVFSSGGTPIAPAKSITLNGGAKSGVVNCPPSTPSASCNSVSYAPLNASETDGVIDIASGDWASYLSGVTLGGDTSSSTVFCWRRW